jgi:plasmid stabilization system protein ParE
MGKRKLKRVFRQGAISAQQAARDRETRTKIEAEFPPVGTPVLSDPISAPLRKAIEASEKSAYQISKEAGISQIMISRFLAGERDIRTATADRIAHVLGLKLGRDT